MAGTVSSPYSPVSYKTNYLFAALLGFTTIPAIIVMVEAATKLRRGAYYNTYMGLVAGTMVTVFNVTSLIFKDYLLTGNLYLKCWPLAVCMLTGLARFLYCIFNDMNDDGLGFGMFVVSTIIYLLFVHSTMFRPFRLKKVEYDIPTFVAPLATPPAYSKT